jgi:hypothetical protein
MKPMYETGQLPLAEMEKLGLYKDGQIILEPDDLDALLRGRRTELVSLRELKADGFEIDQLDAKLSVVPDWDNKLTLKIHPIYKQPQKHEMLLPTEADLLTNGQLTNLSKTYNTPPDKKKTFIVEYDPETREFISYTAEEVQVPDHVNGEFLDQKQKELFRKGEIVTLSDGTRLQHRASESKGIVSDRAALILSVLLDGGISYLLIRGIRNLLNSKTAQRDGNSEDFLETLKGMEKQQWHEEKRLRQQQKPENPEQEQTQTRARAR